jgi:hypothetical protein
MVRQNSRKTKIDNDCIELGSKLLADYYRKISGNEEEKMHSV